MTLNVPKHEKNVKKNLVYRPGIEQILSAKKLRPPNKFMKTLLKLPQRQF